MNNQPTMPKFKWWNLVRAFFAVLLVSTILRALAHGEPPALWIVEPVERAATTDSHRHAFIPPINAPLPLQGVPFVNAAGLSVTRISDVTAAGGYPNNPIAWDGKRGAGLHNGYSHYSCANRTGGYALAFGVTPMSTLWRLADYKCMGAPRSKSGAYLGDATEPRWTRRTDEPATMLYYHVGRALLRQDVLKGAASEETLYILPDTILQTDDNELSNDGRYGICKLLNGAGVVFDYFAGKPLPGTISNATSGLDVSPDGRWAVRYGATSTGPTYYRISDLAAGDSSSGFVRPDRGGHGGWAWGYDGRCKAIYPSNADDWIKAFDPETRGTIKLMYMYEGGKYLNMHVARCSNPERRGWALVSTYMTSDAAWGYNQLFMLEIKPLVNPDNSTVPVAERPRVWRLGHTQGQYIGTATTKDYWCETFASVDMAGNSVWWGANWLGTDNLELYRLALPSGWHAALSGYPAPTPAPTPVDTLTTFYGAGIAFSGVGPATVTLARATATPTPTPKPVAYRYKVSGYGYGYESKDDAIGPTTAKSYAPLVLFTPPPRNTAIPTCIFQRFDLAALAGKNIIRATAIFKHSATTEYGAHPTGTENIPLVLVNGEDFQSAYLAHPELKGEWQYNGASWRFRKQAPDDKGTPWSNQPSRSLNPESARTGDASTAFDPVTSSTPRLCFSTKGTTSTVDVTEYARRFAGRSLQFSADAGQATPTNAPFGSASNPDKLVFLIRQGVLVDETELVLEVQ